jgi:hypothetical protein
VSKSYKPVNEKYISPKGIAFPIGMVIITVTNINPTNWTYGTWESFGQGMCLVGLDSSQTEFNTELKTGGSKYLQSHNHTGSTSENGYHSHSTSFKFSGGSGSSYAISWSTGTWQGPYDNAIGAVSVYGSGSHTHSFTTGNSGSGSSQNLQPYIVVHFWRRTS